MTTQQKFLKDLYLQFVNDFLTIEGIANYYVGISEKEMAAMIAEGKEIHEKSLDVEIENN